MTLTPDALLDLFRSNVEDTDEDDPLWTDTEMYSYMDEAQKAFARGTDYFSDSTTPEITAVTLTAGQAFADLDPRITKLRGGRAAATGYQLTSVKYDDMDRTYYGRDSYARYQYTSFNKTNWEVSTGRPEYMITDLEPNKIRLVPIPVVDDVLNIRVYRLPLYDIDEDNTAEFEIREREYQRGLMFYMKYLAYQKNDSDVYNTDLSEEGLRLFQEFLLRTRRDLRRARFGSTMGNVQYGGL